jgi:type VI secretion system protein ImpJ
MRALLARPKWAVGQVLLPEHFLGLEEALSAEAALRSASLGLPAHGIAKLEWNGDDPTNGILWVSTLTAFLSDGTLVDVPGNAAIISPLDLKLAGRRIVDVYAHVLPDHDASASKPLPSREIARVVHRVVLTTDSALAGSQGRIDLGRFDMDDRGRFRLSEEVVPPLVRLGVTPYLAPRFDGIARELAEIEASLDDRALEALATANSAMPVFRARVEVRKVRALLEDIGRGVHLHPYLVFSALRSLALELGLLDEHAAPFSPPAYDHDDLAPCLDAILTEISTRGQAPHADQPAVPFAIKEGRLVASDLPDDALMADELYVAVLRSNAKERLSLDGAVVASPSRLRAVQEHALRAMRLAPTSKPPLRHAFGGPVDFYAILGAGALPGEDRREWKVVVRERALAFSPPNDIGAARLFLCWKTS